MEFKVENRDITEACTTIMKATSELNPILFLEAVEKLITDTFGDEYYVLHKIHKYDGQDDTCFRTHSIGCDMNIHRMDSDINQDIPYNINIRSVKANHGNDGLVTLISIGGIYRAFPNSEWSMSSSKEYELKSMILYLTFCLNKFFNHK